MKTKKKKKNNTLNPKQERFCQEYVIDLNGTQAAIRAGYSKKTANEQAARMLAKVSIKSRVKQLQDKLAEKHDNLREKVIEEFRRIAFFDIRKLHNKNGKLKKISELDDETAAAIGGIEVIVSQNEDDVDEIHKIKVTDKTRSLENLGKHLSIYPSEKVLNLNYDLNKLSDEQLQRVANGEPLEKVIAELGK